MADFDDLPLAASLRGWERFFSKTGHPIGRGRLSAAVDRGELKVVTSNAAGPNRKQLVTRASILRWLDGDMPPSAHAQQRLAEIVERKERLDRS